MTDKTSELDALLFEGEDFTPKKNSKFPDQPPETIKIEKLSFGDFAKALSLAAPMAGVFKSVGKTDELNVTALMVSFTEPLMQLVTLMSRKPRAWVDALDPDEGIILAAKCLGVNMDFFIRVMTVTLKDHLSPVLGRLLSLATKGLNLGDVMPPPKAAVTDGAIQSVS